MEYRQGYPQLAAFSIASSNFTVLKRFDYLHMRSLLEKQDQLIELEERLHQCDDDETAQLNLSSRRQDSNQGRRALMEQIRRALGHYGTIEEPPR